MYKSTLKILFTTLIVVLIVSTLFRLLGSTERIEADIYFVDEPGVSFSNATLAYPFLEPEKVRIYSEQQPHGMLVPRDQLGAMKIKRVHRPFLFWLVLATSVAVSITWLAYCVRTLIRMADHAEEESSATEPEQRAKEQSIIAPVALLGIVTVAVLGGGYSMTERLVWLHSGKEIAVYSKGVIAELKVSGCDSREPHEPVEVQQSEDKWIIRCGMFWPTSKVVLESAPTVVVPPWG